MPTVINISKNADCVFGFSQRNWKVFEIDFYDHSFCQFRQFSVKKIGVFFSKTSVTIKVFGWSLFYNILLYLARSPVKNA
jgi:hypothetical protein